MDSKEIAYQTNEETEQLTSQPRPASSAVTLQEQLQSQPTQTRTAVINVQEDEMYVTLMLRLLFSGVE